MTVLDCDRVGIVLALGSDEVAASQRAEWYLNKVAAFDATITFDDDDVKALIGIANKHPQVIPRLVVTYHRTADGRWSKAHRYLHPKTGRAYVTDDGVTSATGELAAVEKGPAQ